MVSIISSHPARRSLIIGHYRNYFNELKQLSSAFLFYYQSFHHGFERSSLIAGKKSFSICWENKPAFLQFPF